MKASDKYPLLIGHYSKGPKELHGIEEVATLICTEGRYEDITVRTPDNRFFLSTYGMYLNKIEDLDYREELLKVLVPMQHKVERGVFGEKEESTETDEKMATRLAKATQADYKKYIVCLDGDDRNFTAYDTGKKWNGWDCPLFTKEIGLRMCESLTMDNCKLTYDESKDCFIADFPYEDVTSEYEGTDYNIDGELVRLYPIGSEEWVWCKSHIKLDEDEDEEESDAICIEETTEELVTEGLTPLM